MNLRTAFLINAVVNAFLGLAQLLAPAALLSAFGMSASAATLVVSREYGAAALGLAVMNWLARSWEASSARDGLAQGMTVFYALAAVASVVAVVDGSLGASAGWSGAVTFAVLAAINDGLRLAERSGDVS